MKIMNTKTKLKYVNKLVLITGILLFSACSTQQPVLYPNGHLNKVGKIAADEDIKYCMTLANNSGALPGKSKEVLSQAAEGSVIGAATGAVTGAIYDHAARGAAAGAAGGGTAGMARGLIHSGEPNHTYKRFVDKCLRNKGYDPVGWS